MSREELIQEIVRRVMQKILECEKNNCPSSNVTSNQSSTCSCSSNVEQNTASTCCCEATPVKDMHVDKRLLSERDVIDAVKAGVTELHFSKKTIVTDLAKDYAARHKLSLIKD